MLNIRKLNISGTEISDDSDAFVIAEIGHNHQGDVELCEKFFIEAAAAGVNAVKLQKRDNKSLYTNDFYNSPYEGPTSFGDTYGKHREFLEFDFDQYKHLQEFARKLGLIFFATAFDFKSADFLMELGVPAIKVASGDLKSAPLISYLSKFKIPLILSTGGASLLEIKRAMKDVNPEQIALLQCTAAYPAEAEDMNLKVISQFRNEFPNTVVGLSSHDRGIAFPVAAFALGARVIEKHFTLDRTMKGTDHSYSLEPTGMKKMVRDLRLTRTAMGLENKTILDKEKAPIRKMGKMLVYSSSISAGETLKNVHFELKSPQDGLNPQELDKFLGKKLLINVKKNQLVKFSDIENQ